MPFLKSIRRSSFVEKEKRKKKSNNSWKPPFERRPSRRSSLDCRAHDLRLSFTGRVFFLYGGKMKWKEEKKKNEEKKNHHFLVLTLLLRVVKKTARTSNSPKHDRTSSTIPVLFWEGWRDR
jgi:hypothetical protein